MTIYFLKPIQRLEDDYVTGHVHFPSKFVIHFEEEANALVTVEAKVTWELLVVKLEFGRFTARVTRNNVVMIEEGNGS